MERLALLDSPSSRPMPNMVPAPKLTAATVRSDVVDSGMAPWSRAEFAGDTDDTALEQG